MNQRLRLSRWLDLEIGGEAASEVVVHVQRARAISLPVEQLDESSDRAFIVRGEGRRASRPRGGAERVSCLVVANGELPRGVERAALKPRALLVHPALEPERVRNEERIEELAAVQRD